MGDWKEKGNKVLDDVQNHPQVKGAVEAARKNPKDAILAVLTLVGLILSFYWIGGLIVGIAASLLGPKTIRDVWEEAAQFYETEGPLPTITAGLVVLFLLIHTFFLVVGVLAGLTVKLLFAKKEAPRSK